MAQRIIERYLDDDWAEENYANHTLIRKASPSTPYYTLGTHKYIPSYSLERLNL